MSGVETSPHDRGAGEFSCNSRVTVRLTPRLNARIDDLVDAGAYPNRSEAIRALLDAGLEDKHPGLEVP